MQKLCRLRMNTLLLLCVSQFVLSCGFQLRGSQALPENFSDVAIKASSQYAALARTLDDRLPVYQLNGTLIASQNMVESSYEETVLLNIQPESLERRLLSLFSSGQVAEYELIYSVDYEVFFPHRETIEHTIVVAREYQEDPNQILAKSRELEDVIQEMRNDVADRMIRLLSSQYATSTVIIDSEKPPLQN